MLDSQKFSKGGLEYVEDPAPWHPVDRLEPEDENDGGEYQLGELGAVTAAGLVAVLHLIEPKNPRNPNAWRGSLVKLAVLMHSIIPSVRSVPLSEIAEALGVSKSMLSYRAVRLREFAGGTSAGGKTETARRKLSASTADAWVKRKVLGDEFQATHPTRDTAKGVKIRARKQARGAGETPGNG